MKTEVEVKIREQLRREAEEAITTIMIILLVKKSRIPHSREVIYRRVVSQILETNRLFMMIRTLRLNHRAVYLKNPNLLNKSMRKIHPHKKAIAARREHPLNR